MLAFYRSSSAFGTTSDIWLKLLPNGEPVQVTHDPHLEIRHRVLSRRRSHRVHRSSRMSPAFFRPTSSPRSAAIPNCFCRIRRGLSWLDDGHLLFSQIKTGIHMGVVTSKPDRSDLREIYFPAHERGMAHYSYLSPDKKWVLLVEMIDEFRPCRVVPFSGGSPGRQVGPRRRLPLRGVVPRREMDVHDGPGGRPNPLVAPAFSRWTTGANHLRFQRKNPASRWLPTADR